MSMLYFIIVLAITVTIVAVLHIFLVHYLKNYDENVNKQKIYWRNRYEFCRKNQNYKLKKSDLRRLKKTINISAFFQTLGELSQDEMETVLLENKAELISIGRKSSSTTLKAYFAYELSILSWESKEVYAKFDELMMEFLLDSSVYCRENALKSLYLFGDAGNIVDAYVKLSKNKIYHSEKLLTDGLLSFKGDCKELFRLLLENWEELEECYQVALINGLLYKNEHSFDKQIVRHLDTTESMDVKCSILRVLGKVQSETHKKVLIDQLEKHKENPQWEPASVAVTLLGFYKKDIQVEEYLCECITSKNWYIRMNSARALIQMGISQERINSIQNGTDSYAKNALEYAIGQKEGVSSD